MDVWQIALYAFAAFLALRSLVSLMERHRLLTLQKLAEDHQRKLAEERATKKAEDAAKKAA